MPLEPSPDSPTEDSCEPGDWDVYRELSATYWQNESNEGFRLQISSEREMLASEPR